MEPENLTVRVLIDIRDEIRGVKGELVEMKSELGGIKDELIHVNERLATVETTLEETGAQVRFIGRSMGVLRSQRRGHEKRLDELERRVGDLERGR